MVIRSGAKGVKARHSIKTNAQCFETFQGFSKTIKFLFFSSIYGIILLIHGNSIFHFKVNSMFKFLFNASTMIHFDSPSSHVKNTNFDYPRLFHQLFKYENRITWSPPRSNNIIWLDGMSIRIGKRAFHSIRERFEINFFGIHFITTVICGWIINGMAWICVH